MLDQLYIHLERESLPINNALNSALDQLPSPAVHIARHVFSAGGKRLRPFLTVLSANICGYSRPSIYDLAASIEMLHAATLLHDDVLDHAQLRRGKPTAHTIFGVAETILAGDALLALGNQIVASFDMPTLSAAYSHATMQTASGEILEMASLNNPLLSHPEYEEIARGKTACLIASACSMGAIAAGAEKSLVSAFHIYGENLGLAFQLVDDALDFAPEAQTGKPRGGDLREGKMTPPLRLYRANLNEQNREDFDRKFSAGAFNQEQIEKISKEVGPYARESLSLADDCIQKAKAALNAMREMPEKELLLQMADYVRNRTK